MNLPPVLTLLSVLGALASTLLGCAAPDSTTSDPVGGPSHGGINGGGGIGVLCPSGLRVLDLYEAEEVHGLSVPSRFASLDEALGAFGVALVRHQAADTPAALEYWTPEKIAEQTRREIVDRFAFLPAGERLAFTGDATLPKLAPGCRFVQIARFEGAKSWDRIVQVDREYWSRLDFANQAALAYHEWIYWEAKRGGARTSDETRLMLGRVFAGVAGEPLFAPVYAAPERIWCGAGGGSGARPAAPGAPPQPVFDLYAIDETRDGVRGLGIYFLQFNGLYRLSRTSAFFPGATLAQMAASRLPELEASVLDLSSSGGRTWRFSIRSLSGINSVGPLTHVEVRASDAGSPLPGFSFGFCNWRR